MKRKSGKNLEWAESDNEDKYLRSTTALNRRDTVTRRSFLGNVSRLGAGAAISTLAAQRAASAQDAAGVQSGIEPEREIGPLTGKKRAKRSFQIRTDAAQRERDLPITEHPTNSDEELYANKIGSYSKGLPHNSLGEVNLTAFDSMIRALTSGLPTDFELITLGGTVKLTNPQAGLAFDMLGADAHALAMRPAPAFASAEEAGEIAENYWMALLRDVAFSEYETDPLAGRAASDLSRFSDFRGPKANGLVVPGTLFRDNLPGALSGPYISQFMWKDTPFGAEQIDRRMRTLFPGVDYMTNYQQWLAIENGSPAIPPPFDLTQRYIRNGRDLSQWVHIDVLFQAYFEAMLILFSIGAPIDAGNPYRTSRTQIGFGTLGDPYIAAAMCGVATRALKAVWYQKWFVHRRLRPEMFAGRVHNHLTAAANYPIHADILNSMAVAEVFSRHGTYLLPMAFPEGSPTHPAYGAGHATVAGACVTVLKAFFDESFVIPNPVQSSPDGLSLVPYSGAALTVGGELNKLASNVATGRNIAGVHWRSDGTESLKLGEEVAIRYLREERACFNESFNGFNLTKFDGTSITI
ncbi:MAG TPA: vanadium-dependent haloperoxidase [Blastocatellia bacterium]|nr:vanadium-dependent haloperoxidase [Blastocatellia bacterium]